ncbi:MAG: hypothetical protein JST68_23185 [Bacteroidetes bacterium]|nr:hypothetical protein [Bacteroidota bacterium]
MSKVTTPESTPNPVPEPSSNAVPNPTSTSNRKPKRFLSIRLTDAEFADVQSRLSTTTCRSLTEYVRKRLLGKATTIKTRNESQDQLLQELIQVKNNLNRLIEIAEDHHHTEAFLQLKEIKSILLQIAQKCLQ